MAHEPITANSTIATVAAVHGSSCDSGTRVFGETAGGGHGVRGLAASNGPGVHGFIGVSGLCTGGGSGVTGESDSGDGVFARPASACMAKADGLQDFLKVMSK